jgi:hypothetical protein
MLIEASGALLPKLGDTFAGHMDREALNDYPSVSTTSPIEIVTFEPGREVAWTVRGQLNLSHVYGYRHDCNIARPVQQPARMRSAALSHLARWP